MRDFYNHTTREPATQSGMIDDAILVMDYWLGHAVQQIYSTFGDVVSISTKHKDLLKFGRSESIDSTKSTIMMLPGGLENEVYVNSNIIDTISCSSAGLTHNVMIEGHTVNSAGEFTFVVQSSALNGQNKVTIATPLARMTRIYNNDSTELNGAEVYGYQDSAITAGVPDVSSYCHCMIATGEEQSEKASTTISNSDYWIITGAYSSVLQKSGSPLTNVEIEMRLKGKVFRKAMDIGVSNTQGVFELFRPYLIVPKNSDIRLRAKSSTANTEMSGGLIGILGAIVE